MSVERAGGPGLTAFPPVECWDDWREYDPKRWPERVERSYALVPTSCSDCEAACGLLAWIDKETGSIRKFEGNPLHPATPGRSCAMGPATINRIHDPERIPHPLRRKGPRGAGKWERVSWDAALDEIAQRLRRAFEEGRRDEVMYHVGRPGHERAGHDAHTDACSAAARLGYALWSGDDRPSPDYANARFLLLLSAYPFEAGHDFNPHAQGILKAAEAGVELAVMDPRLSNAASVAQHWLPTYPGSEAAVLLAMARVILDERLADLAFVERWTNWRDYLKSRRPEAEPRFADFVTALEEHYAQFTPAFAEAESGVDRQKIVAVARRIGAARGAFASRLWRGAASGNLGGWQVARALQLLTVLTGSVGTRGGTSPSAWNEWKPHLRDEPPAHGLWNELLFPNEWPLSHHEMSFLLPHFLKEGRGRLDTYFTRADNPVWANPDGMTWMEVLRDEQLVGCHVALTPTWNETAAFADLVLPMGVTGERHGVRSREARAGVWVGFQQPVLRAWRERSGESFEHTWQANPHEVWEEDELWIELSWRIDPDGEMGIRRRFESPYRPGEKLRVDEHYRWIFDNTVPGLPEAAAEKGMEPLEYMRRFGAFLIRGELRELHEAPVSPPEGATTDPDTGVVTAAGAAVEVGDGAVQGFPTPSRRLEIFSRTLEQWRWPEYALPGYVRSHIHRQSLDIARGELVLVPRFRPPTMIHTRSGEAKYLNEISHRNPVWMYTRDAERLGLTTGDLIRVKTEIGYFVNRLWVTEAIAPGVVACSHHMGRWRLNEDEGSRWSATPVRIEPRGDGWLLRRQSGLGPFHSVDPDSSRIWWSDGGVHQNLAFPVHPDPVSGNHCWHQKVTVSRAGSDHRYGDVYVDPRRSVEVYREWLAMARPGPGPGGQRRPAWLQRPLRPRPEAFSV